MEDRELDALVAEKVMDFAWFHCEAETGVRRNQFFTELEAKVWRAAGWTLKKIPTPPPPDQFNDDSVTPHYSADISAAMEVVEKLASFGVRVQIERDVRPPFWNVSIKKFDDGWHFIVRNEGDTLPRVICEAARIAMNRVDPKTR